MCINDNQQITWGQPDKLLGGNLRWTSIPSRGSRNTPSRFILQKPDISAGTDEPSGSLNYDWGQTSPFTVKLNKLTVTDSNGNYGDNYYNL